MIRVEMGARKVLLLFCKLFLLVVVFVFNSGVVVAISPEQKRLYDSGVYYFDHEVAPPTSTACGGSASLAGNDNTEKVWNFLVGKGLQPEQAAGVMGNFAIESEFDPFNQENRLPWPTGGWGLAQWTGGRRDTLRDSVVSALGAEFYIPTEEAASKIGTPDEDRLLQHQLEFMYNESNQRTVVNDSGTKEWAGLQATTSAEEAAVFWLENFERAGIPHLDNRLGEANKFLMLYGSGGNTAQPPTGSAGCALDPSGCPTSTITEDQIVDAQGIRVHSCISSEVDRIVTLARTQGIELSGGGWRDGQAQIELRRAHCGTSQHDIYEKSPSACSPPTARPGASNHERGTAVDFECNGGSISSKSNPCFQFLLNNTSLKNLDSEPWHWSIDGG